MTSYRRKIEKGWLLLLLTVLCLGITKYYHTEQTWVHQEMPARTDSTREPYQVTQSRNQVNQSQNQVTQSRNQLNQSTNQVTQSRNQVTQSRNQVAQSQNQMTQSQNQVSQSQNHVTQSPKQVTQSLNQIQERNKQSSDHVLFFNRVPKTGSEMFVLLLQWLQGVNGFRHIRLPRGDRRRLLDSEQESLVNEVWKVTRREAVPVSFDRHVYFTNFTLFDRQPPVFLNLVRDPVDKAVSRFYYGRVTPSPLNPDIKFARSSTTKKAIKYDRFEDCLDNQDPECSFQNGRPYDLAIPYFCGHHQQCMVLNDPWALATAKKNIEQFYPVVGVLEDLNSTLLVLEKKLPLFFQGVTDMYFHELLEPHRNANRMRPRTIKESVRKTLEKQLETEYDLYYWLRARLRRQVFKIKR